MISFLQALPVGNAVRVLLAPPDGAVSWRVLRKTVNTFTDQNDASAAIVYDGDDSGFVDIQTLENGTVYYYKPFYQAADASWSTAASASATPAYASNLLGADPLSLVRDRLEAALRGDVAAGELQHTLGYIPVLTAPPTFEGTEFPIVTVHMTNLGRAISALHENIGVDAFDPITQEWTSVEGIICHVQLQIVAWVVGNGDVRIALRRAIAKALLLNLPVFFDQGLGQVEFTQSDIEDLESYNSPVYQTVTSLSCIVPLAVDSLTPPTVDVIQAFAAAA